MDGTLRVSQVSTGDVLHKIKDHGCPVLCAQFSPCGKYLATGGLDGVVYIYSYGSSVYHEGKKALVDAETVRVLSTEDKMKRVFADSNRRNFYRLNESERQATMKQQAAQLVALPETNKRKDKQIERMRKELNAYAKEHGLTEDGGKRSTTTNPANTLQNRGKPIAKLHDHKVISFT